MTTSPRDTFDDLRAIVDPVLSSAFAQPQHSSLEPLSAAIEYSLLAPGKRIRPLLTLAAAETCGGDPVATAPIAAAFELVHAYSLVHDDLPAMDNDDLRRGMPTSHRVFGEAGAILVGDALQARAFELIAHAEQIDARARVAIVALLAKAAGWQGMVGGQFLDIDETRTDTTNLDALRNVHDRKTGAMIAGAVAAGAIAAGATDKSVESFAEYGRDLGWMFQLVDDLLDATGDAQTLGKTPGKDERAGKVTAVNAFGGVAALRSAVDEQLERCLRIAAAMPHGGGRLVTIAQFIHGRNH